MTGVGVVGRLAAAGLAALALAGGAEARRIAPEQAPPEWLAYAEAATRTITGWVNGETPPAPRLREALIGAAAEGAAPPPLVLTVWVAKDGAVTRVEPVAPPSAATRDDLRSLLVGLRLGPPPRRMRQPMRLALQVLPAPAP